MADEQPKPAGPVPADQLDRVFEALLRSRYFLQPAARAQLEAFLTPETGWALAILFGVWAGLQLVAVGELVDLILGVTAGWVILKVFGRLKDAVLSAAAAKTWDEIDKAARLFAAVEVEIGIDILAGLAASRAFRLLEAKILRFRPLRRAVGGKEGAAPSVKPSRPAVPEPPPRVPGGGGPLRPPVEPPPPPREPVFEPPPREPVFEPPPPGAEPVSPAAAELEAGGAEVVAEETAIVPAKPGATSTDLRSVSLSRLRGAAAGIATVEGAPAVGAAGKELFNNAKDRLDQALSVGKWVLLGTGIVVLGVGTAVAVGSARRAINF